MGTALKRIKDYFEREVWMTDLAGLGRLRVLQVKTLRLAYVIVEGALDAELSLRATGLLYTILLTIVPLLAVSFSLLKAFGVDTRLLILLYYFLEPLGTVGIDISMKIMGFVGNVKAGILGSVGLITLIYTAASAVQKMEVALNYIWRIKDTRDFFNRFLNYISVLLISPVLAVAAVGVTASFMSSGLMKKMSSVAAVEFAIHAAGIVIPYVLICVAFAFVYFLLPNTKVRIGAALGGGITAGIMWQTTGWIFASFVASSARYSAIYSGFAALILLLIWLYWNFLILLLGAKVSFYIQRPGLSGPFGRASAADCRLKEKTAMTVMYLIGDNFRRGEQPWTAVSLAERTGTPPDILSEVIAALNTKGLIISSCDQPPALAPARDIESITMGEVFESVRAPETGSDDSRKSQQSIPEVEDMMARIDAAAKSALERETVGTIVRRRSQPDR